MAEADGERPRSGARAAVLGARRAASEWPWRAGRAFDAISDWIAGALRIEADSGRLAPWLAVGFGIGILLYFGAPAEPSVWAPFAALVAFAAIAWASRERPFAFALALALVSIAAGFGAGCLRGLVVAHATLVRPTGTLTLSGFVEARDATERSDRVVLRLTKTTGPGASRAPERVRVALRRGTAPNVGEHVSLRAQLVPLLGPTRPGGFDYARNSYFAEIGASGFALGRARTAERPGAIPIDIRVLAAIETMRRKMHARIRALLPGEIGAIASALVTGIRDEITPEVNEAMRISGLAHVLSISGLHMVLAVGALFALARGVLVLIPGLALRRPVKKWAALVALAGATGYLVLSGAAVPTQRAYIMVAIVLVGVLIDRPALTVRSLATAAVALLALEPEAILHPSFQMSFAATLALIALFEHLAPLLARPPAPGSGVVGRFSERVGRWMLLGALTSLAAGVATTAYAAFHFHRLAPFGLVANVLAMPVISFVIMPAALVSVLLMPFGYDALGWQMMGFGIELMLAIARWVTALPGAEGRVAAFGAGAMLIATAGLLVLTLPASRLRLGGIPLAGLALLLMVSAPRPDVLVEAEGRVVAVRGTDGRLSILDARRGRIAAENWLAADGDGRKLTSELAAGFTCDRVRCTSRISDGSMVVVARTVEALADACGEGGLVVAGFEVPQSCAAPLVDRRVLATTGAISLRRVDGRWIADPVRSPTADRPWFGRRVAPDAAALSRLDRLRQGISSVGREAPPGNVDDPPEDVEEADDAN
jgi:competence protein ComEC